MKHYFIASIKINDPEQYREYQQQARLISQKYSGKYITVDDTPELLEGQWDYTKVVVIEFPSREELMRWYQSPEYQKIVGLRLDSTQSDTIIAKGYFIDP